MSLADREVLPATGHSVSKAGYGGETRSGKGLEQVAIREAVPHPERGPVRKRVINPNVEVVVAIALHRRRDEVLERHIAIRQRIKGGYSTADRIDELIRNLVAGKRLLSERIDRRAEQALRKVAVSFSRGRHVRDPRYPLPHPRALVIHKQERPVFDYRAACRSPELISLVPGRSYAFT